MYAIFIRTSPLMALALCLGCAGCSSDAFRQVADRSPSGQAAALTGNGLSGRLVLTGSSTIAPLALEIANRFQELHPGVRIDVQTGGSSRGIADVRSGTADIGMASRALKQDETTLFAHQIAFDGICMIVHRDNPVESLSDEDVVAIYTDRTNNWSQLAGKNAPIVVANKAEGRATLEVFLEYFKLQNKDIQADVIVGENQQAIKTVAGNPNAIAYVSIGTANYEAEHGTPVRLVKSGGVAPTAENVASGEFPITRPLNLVTKDVPTGLAKEFIDFARSSDVNHLVEALYFVPINR